MSQRTLRTAAVCLLIAGLLSFGAPTAAEARTFDFDDGFAQRVERFVSAQSSFLASLWSGLTDFIAASTATISGDGSK